MIPTLKSTKDFRMFELFHMNRDVDEESQAFQQLVENMREYGFADGCPLHCAKNRGEKIKIKQGHNRFRAAQIAGVPVYYIISENPIPIDKLEKAGPGKWSPKDYLICYCKKGMDDYLTLKSYMDRTGIGLYNAASMFHGDTAGSGNCFKGNKFNGGQFKIKNLDHPIQVEKIVTFLKSIGIGYATHKALVASISRFIFVKEFDTTVFREKAEKFSFLFKKQRGLFEYTQMIEEIYNYHSPTKTRINLAFLAQQEANNRNVFIHKKG